MKPSTLTPLLLILTGLAFAPHLEAQFQTPQASPRASISQTVGLTDVEVDYSRPGVKGRVIWGELVPYETLWRTGANAATTIEFSRDVVFEGKAVKAGRYALFTIPREGAWTVILNGNPDQPGTSQYDESLDVARVEIVPTRTPAPVERMTFVFPTVGDDEAVLRLEWERLALPMRIEVDTSDQVIESARAAIARMRDWRVPYRAAVYALEAGLIDEEVLGWTEVALDIEENYPTLSLRARALEQAGRTSEALATARRALEVAATMERRPDVSATEALIRRLER
ncbi:MAG: DUF2911 domain-containing protein [Acidobacteria bacterium]|nr:DUF2911 domain-containing protein [Acidobacteriota bacterium]